MRTDTIYDKKNEKEREIQGAPTIIDNDMLSYSLTTMMCFLTREWYGFPAYTVKLFIKVYHKITYKEDLKITSKRCVLEMICFSLGFWLWCAFYNRSLKKHIILLSKCTSRLVNKRIHIKLVSSAHSKNWRIQHDRLYWFKFRFLTLLALCKIFSCYKWAI